METIIALATPPIKSAIHIIRISGDNAVNIVNKYFTVDISKDKKKTVHFGYIVNKKIIDQVVLIFYPHPHSYTGEDVIEIMTHGNNLIDNEIIQLFIKNGMRMATNGEFTSRAYLNKKIDLVQAEAVNDLINATTNEAREIINLSLNGETSKLLLPIKKGLLDLISNIEVNIDYPEYQDIEQVNRKKIKSKLELYHKQLQSLIADGQQGLIIKDGIKVAIIGKPNVGKSTLFNALIKEDKAIVTNTPGTTRDIVEGDVSINGILFHFMDTAGIRKTSNKIENIGVKKALITAENADLIINVLESNNDAPQKIKFDVPVIKVINKSDLIKKKDKDKIYVSALKNNIQSLKNEIGKIYNFNSFKTSKPSFANARQLGLLQQADDLILEIFKELKNDTPMDILSTLIKSLLDLILEVFGEKTSLDLIKEIFSRFCVGK